MGENISKVMNKEDIEVLNLNNLSGEQRIMGLKEEDQAQIYYFKELE